VATGDWNNDQKIDWITTGVTPAAGAVPGGQQMLRIMTWNAGASAFSAGPNFTFPTGSAAVLFTGAADFNRDGRLDLLATLADGSVFLLPQLPTGDIGTPEPVGTGTFVPASVNIVGYDATCAVPQVYAVRADGSAVLLSFDRLVGGGCNPTDDYTVTTRTVATSKMAPEGAAPDIDGNCVADVVVASVNSTGAKEYSVLQVPSRAGSPDLGGLLKPFVGFAPATAFGAAAFADWTGNGAVDVLIPACLESDGRASTVACPVGQFNAFVMVPSTVVGSSCPGDNCCAGHGWSFESLAEGAVVGADPRVKIVNLSSCDASAAGAFYVESAVTLRPGDYDDDGHMDALVSSPRGPLVLTGTGAGALRCDLLSGFVGGRRSLLGNRSADPFFFDIDGDGRLDLVTTNTRLDDAAAQGGTVLAFYGNSADIGNYYLTAVTINGASAGGNTGWGAAVVGATHRFQFTDINQNVHTATATQATTSAAAALQPARAHFGLAVTFSYIVNYATGYGDGTGAKTHSWPVYLMPNSQMVVIASPTSSPDDWTLKLFLYGQRYMRLVLYAWLASLGVVGIPLAVLKVREIQSDRRDLHRNE